MISSSGVPVTRQKLAYIAISFESSTRTPCCWAWGWARPASPAVSLGVFSSGLSVALDTEDSFNFAIVVLHACHAAWGGVYDLYHNSFLSSRRRQKPTHPWASVL